MKAACLRALPLCLALLVLLSACGPKQPPAPAPEPTPEPTPSLHFTRETMPRLNGSTAMVPMAEAVCCAMLGESREQVADLVQFSKTTQSYFQLMNGDADLLIVGEHNQDVLDRREQLCFRWEKTAFSNDAFVFVVNEANPVDSLTLEEIRGIYTGEIVNWAQVGGEDRAIVPLQRNPEAGSQTLMKKLVMGNTPMMEPPVSYVIAAMGTLMEAVKSYDGSPGAIGYSVYYYAEEMRMAQGLKLLQVEGVAPSDETIRSGAYPLLNPNYVVLPADAAADAPNRLLYNWILSEEGQRLAAREGYVPVMDIPPETDETPPPPQLTPVGSRWYAELPDALLPRADYGPLVPYAGQRATGQWPAMDGCVYGLMTRDGAAVTGAVFASVTAPGYMQAGEWKTLPFLLLRQGVSAGETILNRLAVAAPDGSWCTGSDYRLCLSSARGLLLFGDEGLTVMDPGGQILAEGMAALEAVEADYTLLLRAMDWGEGYTGQSAGPYLCLCFVSDTLERTDSPGDADFETLYVFDFDTLRVATMDREAFAALIEAEEARGWTAEPGDGETILRRDGESWTIPYVGGERRVDVWNGLVRFDYGGPIYTLEGALVLPASEEAGFLRDELDPEAPGLLLRSSWGAQTVTQDQFFRLDGSPLRELDGLAWLQTESPFPVAVKGGLIEVIQPGYAAYYDLETLDLVYRTVFIDLGE